MGVFDRLFGTPPPATPDELREQLFLAQKTPAKLAELCREHRSAILEHFPAWRTVPEEDRTDPARVARHAEGLIAIAQCFESEYQNRELLDLLTGGSALAGWDKAITEGRALAKVLRFPEAIALLSDTLIDTRELSGEAASRLRAVTLGAIGFCHFQAGETARAVEPAEQALALCEGLGDDEGVLAYLENLYEVRRYLGEGPAAAAFAERRAGALSRLGRGDEALRWRRKASLVRAGEPLLRVAAEVEGELRELDELPALGPIEGTLRFAFVRNRLTLGRSTVLTEEGMELGSRGELDEALERFREAAGADRHDPAPRHQIAFTLLDQGHYDEAVAVYDEVEALAPGWFQARSERWLAAELAAGRIGAASLAALHAEQDPRVAPSDKLAAIDRGLAEAPGLPPLRLARAAVLRTLGLRDECAAELRRALAVAEEPGLRTRVLCDLGMELGPSPEADSLLREAVALRGHLVAAACAEVALSSRPRRT